MTRGLRDELKLARTYQAKIVLGHDQQDSMEDRVTTKFEHSSRSLRHKNLRMRPSKMDANRKWAIVRNEVCVAQ